MKRRIFVKSSITASILSMTGLASAKAHKNIQKPNFDYYEWRTYHFKNHTQKEITNNYLENAFIPALNRQDIHPVGVFERTEPTDEMILYVLITYPSMQRIAEIIEDLKADKNYQQKGKEYLNMSIKEPAYERIESSLMVAFSGIPRIAIPETKERIFEWRRYESHGEFAGNQKVKMFNEGELDIFYKTGLNPVFFGQSIIGDQLPNLTYMITFKNMEEREKNWGKFREHPDWLKLKDEPQYKDTVSNITNYFLKPTDYSQV